MQEDVVGTNLRAIRAARGLSLSGLAALSGVSKAMLGQVERGESSPTIATLWKLARGLELPLSAFVEGPVEAGRVEGGFAYRTVFAFDPAFGTETFEITLGPGWEHRSEAHAGGVVEDVFAGSGEVEIGVAGVWQRCRVGEGVRFAADQPHGYRNPGPVPVRFCNTIHYPAGKRRSAGA